MSHFRLLSLAAAGLGVSLCSSFLDIKKNAFKIKAQHIFSNDETYESKFLQIWDDTKMPVKKSSSKAENVSIEAMKNKEFYISHNTKVGLPNWTLQHITKESMKQELADGWSFKASQRLKMLSSVELFRGLDLDPCVFHHVPPLNNHADRQDNDLWHDFYAYVMHVNKDVKNTYVCSGPVYSPDRTTKTGCLSHFFKVILGENEDEMTWRLECYLIENAPPTSEYNELSDYLITREELQSKVPFLIFPEIDQENVLQSETDKLFPPKRPPAKLL